MVTFNSSAMKPLRFIARLTRQPRKPKPAQVLLQWEKNGRAHVTVQSHAASQAKVLLAVTEDGLTTDVGGGENGGRTLRHAAVVRQLRELGSTDKNTFDTSV
jgi:hypothetical protein